MRRILLSGLLLGCSSIVPAKENVWIIGGGPNPQDSAAQIEFNVNWVVDSLKNLVPDADLHLYYANGRKKGLSVVEWRPPVEGKTPLLPLARVFGEHFAAGYTFRQKRVPDVEGSTQANELIPALRQGLAKIRPNDRALIIYNGHGLRDFKDAAGNYFRLWRDTRFTARQFGQVLDSVNPKVPVRFVLTQCFAGGFERAIHPQARDELALAAGQRCGFFAVSKDKEAEGCSPSTKRTSMPWPMPKTRISRNPLRNCFSIAGNHGIFAGWIPGSYLITSMAIWHEAWHTETACPKQATA
ncbi:MAG: hypothetical protein P8016_16300 [Sedimentisphaerales bacterium]